ncbi:hypothetical protein MMC26_006034 [Xylographa opegraphella]|nr:hypothetical protein [Xylographa opegraphella]
MFGLHGKQIADAAAIARVLGTEWRGFVAGREGFLLDKGLEGRVRWGEMDVMVREPSSQVVCMFLTLYGGTHRSCFHPGFNCLPHIADPAPSLPPAGHLNNAAYVRLAESSRVHFFRAIAPPGSSAEHIRQWQDTCTPQGLGLILRTIAIDYKYPLTFPNHYTIHHRLSSLPSPSPSTPTIIHLTSLLLSTPAQRPAARFQEEIVIFDYRAQKPAQLPAHMLHALHARWEAQERVGAYWRARVAGVEERVGVLEGGSWGREGAVEDRG